MYTVQQLTSAGGSEWQKAGKHRVYFNRLHGLYGLECEYYGSGNISAAYLDGDKISNRQAAMIDSMLRTAKIWYDMLDGKFYAQGLAGSDFSRIVKAIKTLAGDVSVALTAMTPDGYVKADCGHTVPAGQVMSASLGSACQDCYDRMSA